MKKLYILSVLLFFTLIVVGQSTKTWTGNGSNDNWNNNSNWSPTGTPGANSRVIIPSGFNVIIPVQGTFSWTAHSISVGSNSTLTVNGNLNMNGNNIQSNFDIIYNDGTINHNAGVINIYGAESSGSQVEAIVNNGTFNNNSALFIGDSPTIDIEGNGILNAGLFNNNGFIDFFELITQSGIRNTSGGTFNNDGSLYFDANISSRGIWNTGGGIFNNQGSITFDGSVGAANILQNVGSFENEVCGTIKILNGKNINGNSFTNNGKIEINSNLNSSFGPNNGVIYNLGSGAINSTNQKGYITNDLGVCFWNGCNNESITSGGNWYNCPDVVNFGAANKEYVFGNSNGYNNQPFGSNITLASSSDIIVLENGFFKLTGNLVLSGDFSIESGGVVSIKEFNLNQCGYAYINGQIVYVSSSNFGRIQLMPESFLDGAPIVNNGLIIDNSESYDENDFNPNTAFIYGTSVEDGGSTTPFVLGADPSNVLFTPPQVYKAGNSGDLLASIENGNNAIVADQGVSIGTYAAAGMVKYFSCPVKEIYFPLIIEEDNDSDNDGIPDDVDNCPNISNPDQANFDGDSQGDVCDNDDDNDGSPDAVDCEPFNANIYPGGPCNDGDVCTEGDKYDNNCDCAGTFKDTDDNELFLRSSAQRREAKYILDRKSVV